VQTNGGINANTITDNPDPVSLDSEVSHDFDAIDAISGSNSASASASASDADADADADGSTARRLDGSTARRLDGSTVAMAQLTGAAKRSIWTQPGLGVAGLLQTLTSATSNEVAGGGASFTKPEGTFGGDGAVASSGDSGQNQTWEVDANGAEVNGVAVTSVTIAGSITYLWQDNYTESGSGAVVVADGFKIGITSEGGSASLSGGGATPRWPSTELRTL
jgi:hypothetical protein